MTKKRVNKISTIGSKVTTVISVALVLVIVGVILTVTMLTSGASDALRSHVAVVVRMTQDATADQIQGLADAFKDSEYVQNVIYNSPDDILAQEASENAEIIEMLGTNPYSPEFELYLRPDYVDTDSITKISDALLTQQAVDEVYSQLDVLDNVNSFLRQSTLVLTCIGLVFLAIALVLLVNTISLVIYSRRFVIHTMQLVGATRGFIRWPFVRTGAWMGALSGVLASIVICIASAYVIHAGLGSLFFVGWPATLCICGMVVVIGVLMCAIASWFATNRYLRSAYDDLYN